MTSSGRPGDISVHVIALRDEKERSARRRIVRRTTER